MPNRSAKSLSSRKIIVAALILTFLSLSVGLSLNTLRSPVKYTSKAYVQDATGSYNTEPNTPPTLEGSLFSPINCQVGRECTHSFSGTDSNLYDTLTLTVDFLPEGLNAENCQTSQSLVGNKKITCKLSGSSTKPGTFKLMTSLSDGTNSPISKTFTLNID